MTGNTNMDNVISKMAETAILKVMPESLQARIDELTQMPKSWTKSIERLNFNHEQQLKIKRYVSDLELDVPQTYNIKSDIRATMDNSHQADRLKNIGHENELRDMHNPIVVMQANIVDAINQTVNYQKKLSEGSNRVQLAILCIAIASLVVSSYGVWWA